jgi:hypothetical protein
VFPHLGGSPSASKRFPSGKEGEKKANEPPGDTTSGNSCEPFVSLIRGLNCCPPKDRPSPQRRAWLSMESSRPWDPSHESIGMILKRQLALPNLRGTSWLCILSAKIFSKKEVQKAGHPGGAIWYN